MLYVKCVVKLHVWGILEELMRHFMVFNVFHRFKYENPIKFCFFKSRFIAYCFIVMYSWCSYENNDIKVIPTCKYIDRCSPVFFSSKSHRERCPFRFVQNA